MKKCTNWAHFEYQQITCPYCGEEHDYYFGGGEGDKVKCVKCKKRFVLGEEG